MGDLRLMRYVIAGKKTTFNEYLKDYNYSDLNAIYCRSNVFVDKLTRYDVIVLLPGWFAKSWAKDCLKEIEVLFPTILFDYVDGKIGEKERKCLKSERIYSRFDILDL